MILKYRDPLIVLTLAAILVVLLIDSEMTWRAKALALLIGIVGGISYRRFADWLVELRGWRNVE